MLAGCGGQPADGGKYAATSTLYFEVNCPTGGPNCQEAKQLLDQEIPLYKYSFTPESSRTWPYYKAFALDEHVLLNSLLPPHSQLHQLVPRAKRQRFGGAEYLVVIDLYIVTDTVPDYIVNVYRFEGDSTVLTGTSGRQVGEQRPGMSLSMPEILLHSAVRFSFK